MLKKAIIYVLSTIIWANCTAQTIQARPHSKNYKLEKTLRAMLRFSVPTIGVDSLVKMTDKIVLDARERREFDVSHLPNAQYCGYDNFDPSVLNGIPKHKNIVVYCSIGVRSEKIVEKIKALGYTQVSNLYGSLFEWVNTGHQVVDSTGNNTRKVHTYSRLWAIYLDGKKADKVW
ncbi:MAG: rhodanese-like domain-containing protein [Saprospiraceae bacterium]|nr:rhodanese-like domain-containing protein [Saprospiraceae bacterium]